MKVKTEDNDITECSYDDQPSTGAFHSVVGCCLHLCICIIRIALLGHVIVIVANCCTWSSLVGLYVCLCVC